MKKTLAALSIIFLFGFLVRVISIYPYNTIVGFDQARDLFDSMKIMEGDVRVIGPTAGNNPNLHHGVAFLYFMIPPLLISRNPTVVAIWNGLFNEAAAIILFFVAKSLFKSEKAGYIAAIIASVSYYYIQFSGWLSNPTGTFLTLPLFFLGLIKYKEGKSWGLPISLFFLGLTIQFELFFLYLIPTGIIAWFILKPKLPSLRLALISLTAFVTAVSSMIATEMYFRFAGIKSILFAGTLVGGGKPNLIQDLNVFLSQKWETFYLNVWPQNKEIGTIIGILVVTFLILEIFKKTINRRSSLLLFLWFFSPAIMFILGIHNAPWFYIGRPASAILIVAYIISKIRPRVVVVGIVALIVTANLTAIRDAYGKGQPLLEPDDSAILSSQVLVMDYTYQKSGGRPFAINTVTNPLYINAAFAWNYEWYSQKYGYKPSWLGGEQSPPYDTLPKATGKEERFFLIIDKTPRIPEVHKILARRWAEQRGKPVEERGFEGWNVSMWETKSK